MATTASIAHRTHVILYFSKALIYSELYFGYYMTCHFIVTATAVALFIFE